MIKLTVEELKEYDVYLYPLASGYVSSPALTSDGVQDSDEKQTGAANTDITVFEVDNINPINKLRPFKEIYYNLEALFKGGTATVDLIWKWQARNSGGTWVDLHPAVTETDIGTSYVSRVRKGHLGPQTGLDKVPIDIRLLLQANELNAGYGKVRNTSFITVKVIV